VAAIFHNFGSRFSRWVPDWFSRRVPDWVRTLALYVRLGFLSIFYLPGNLVEIRTGDKIRKSSSCGSSG
jgi:hypothetical protein